MWRNKAGLKTLSVSKVQVVPSGLCKRNKSSFDHTRPNGTKFYTAFNLQPTIGSKIGCQPDMTAESMRGG